MVSTFAIAIGITVFIISELFTVFRATAQKLSVASLKAYLYVKVEDAHILHFNSY